MGRNNQYQGRGGRGRGRGRNGGRGGGRSQNTYKSTKRSEPLKFHPHGSGSAQQKATFETVKEKTVNYLKKTYEYGTDIADTVDKETLFDIESKLPTRKISTKTVAAEKEEEQKTYDEIFKSDLYSYRKRSEEFQKNLSKAYALIYDTYCDKAMQNEIKKRPNYSAIVNDPVALIKAIREIMHEPIREKYPFASVTEAISRLINFKQQDNESLLDYTNRFKQARDVLKSHIGTHFLELFIKNQSTYKSASSTKQTEMISEAWDKWLAYLLIKSSDDKKYKKLKETMSSQYSMKQDQYPKDIDDAVDILNAHKWDNSGKKKSQREKKEKSNKDDDTVSTITESTEMSFAQGQDAIICYCCGEKGHKSNKCSKRTTIPKENWAVRRMEQNYLQSFQEEDDESVSSRETNRSTRTSGSRTQVGWNHLHVGISLTNRVTGEENSSDTLEDMKDHILLDNGSTLSLFTNPDLVVNIRKADDRLQLATNTGVKINDEKADVPNFGEVWYDKDAIANIFGFADMLSKSNRITYDSDVEDAFLIHTKDGTVMKFVRNPNGLYTYKVSDGYKKHVKDQKDKIEHKTSHLIESIEENRKGYTHRQFERAKVARSLYHNVGTPTVQNFKALLRMNVIKNCPVTTEDVDIAERIFGKSMSSLKGKSTRPKTKPVRSDLVEIPDELVEKHRDLELCMDTAKINGLLFLALIDRTIRLRSIVYLKSTKHKEYHKALDVVLREYNGAGFTIKRIY